MSETKFTPGPWQSDDEVVGWLDGDAPAVAVRYASSRGTFSPVCMVAPDLSGRYSVAGSKNPIEDARLIAAAPDLYKEVERALRNEESRLYMLPASDDEKVSAEKDILSASIGLYRAALAKAVGK